MSTRAEHDLRPDRDHPPGDTPFGAGVPLGRWFGIPVKAHWSVLVSVALFATLIAAVYLPEARPGSSTAAYWAAGLVTAPLLFLTLLAHEVAHAVTARHHRIRVRRITLWMLGGLTELEGEAPTPRADALIAAAGPAASLALAAVCAAGAWLATSGSLVAAALGWLASINLVLGVFNLLPGAPLDGGRLLRAALWWRGHDRAAAATKAARAGRTLGMVLVGLGVVEVLAGSVLGLWTVLIGWFVLSGSASERYAVQAESLAGLAVRDAMTATPQVLPDWWTVRECFGRLTAASARQEFFPLVDVGGGLSGAVTLPMLSAVPEDRAATTRLREVRSGQALLTTTPDHDLATLLLPLHLRGGVAVVLDDGHPVGVVTDGDLARLAALVRGRGRTGATSGEGAR